MKTNEVKRIIYDFLKEKVFENYPRYFELMENSYDEIFWGKLKNGSSDKIYISLIDKNISKVAKRFEEYNENGKYYYQKRKRMLVTISVYITASEDFFSLADKLTVDLLEFIEALFTENIDTFNYFSQHNIVINELQVSDIRDKSSISAQTQEFRKEIDIPFEYEEIQEYTPELGCSLDIDINIAK